MIRLIGAAAAGLLCGLSVAAAQTTPTTVALERATNPFLEELRR